MPLPSAIPKRPRALAREDVYHHLSTWIIDGTLQPEEPLRDLDIAERLGVSRTPVREALRRLEDEGLVETALNRWTRVSPLSLVQATALYPVVEALEVLALRLAAPTLTASDHARLHTLNTRLTLALQARDAGAAVDADTAFHDLWITKAGNPELQRTLEGLKRKLRRIERAYFDASSAGEASVAEHTAITHALEAGDLDRALQALQANWQGSLQRLHARAER